MLIIVGSLDKLGYAGEALLAVVAAEVALDRQVGDDRVDAEVGAQIVLGHAMTLGVCDDHFGDVRDLRAAERQLDGRQNDAREKLVELLRRELLALDAEADRVDTRFEQFERRAVGLLRALDRNGLMNEPRVVVVRSSYIGESACLGLQKVYAFEVGSAIVGTDIEALARFPYQLALVVGAFKVGCYRGFPLLGGYRRELRKQLFFGICHNCFRV